MLCVYRADAHFGEVEGGLFGLRPVGHGWDHVEFAVLDVSVLVVGRGPLEFPITVASKLDLTGPDGTVERVEIVLHDETVPVGLPGSPASVDEPGQYTDTDEEAYARYQDRDAVLSTGLFVEPFLLRGLCNDPTSERSCIASGSQI